MLGFELSNEPGIPGARRVSQRIDEYVENSPELAGYAQVLATPHERVALASLGGSRDTGWVEILVFTSGDGDESTRTARWSMDRVAHQTTLPPLANKCILPADYLWAYVRLRPWSKSPRAGSKRLVQNTTVLDFGKVDKSIFSERG